jgi:hypothetical protein
MRAAGPDRWPGGRGCGSGDTMNTFTASDLEAARLLAQARPGDDGAPCSGGPPRSQVAGAVPAHDRGRARARGRPAAASGAGRDQRRAQPGGRVTWPAPAGDRQPGGDDRGSVRPRQPAADACPDGRRLAPHIPRPAGASRPAAVAAVAGTRHRSPLAKGTASCPNQRRRTRAQPAPRRAHPPAAPPRAWRPSRPGSASAPARARPDRQNPHRAACRCGTNPDHTATPDHAPNPPAPLARPATRHTPPPEPRRGPHHGLARQERQPHS